LNELQQIKSQIEKKQFAPVYYLHGEESYFLDQIAGLLDKAVLQPHETSFNKEVFVGAEAKASSVINACRSFPMMAERRLVILKEAHRMAKPEMEKVAKYLEEPVPTTVLVVVAKGIKGGAGKASLKKMKAKGGIEFLSKKMWDRDVKNWLVGHIKEQGFTASHDIPEILVTNLGTNLGHLSNELEKMFLYLRANGQNQLNKDFVFDQINVDKDFNVFELIQALSTRNVKRSHLIIDQMTKNSKINPPVLIVGGLYRFFHTIALVYGEKVSDPNTAKTKLGLNYSQARDALHGKQNFPLAVVYRNIGFVQEADLMVKGQISTQMDADHILKTLVWKLLA
jgi:DNA polymerase-3 subunit delta